MLLNFFLLSVQYAFFCFLGKLDSSTGNLTDLTVRQPEQSSPEGVYNASGPFHQRVPALQPTLSVVFELSVPVFTFFGSMDQRKSCYKCCKFF